MYRITSNPFYKEVVASIDSARSRLEKALRSYNAAISGNEQTDSELAIKCIPHLAKIHNEISIIKKIIKELR